MIDTIYSDPDFLEHHGILGMRWGVRRYQNKDGSLTSTGKQHNRDLRNNTDSVNKDIDTIVSEHKGSLDKKSDDINNQVNAITKKLQDYYTKGLTNKKVRDEHWDAIKKWEELNYEISDEFDFDDAKRESFDSIAGPDIFDDLEKVDNAYMSYFDEITSMSNTLLNKYGNTNIKVLDKYDTVIDVNDYLRTGKTKYHEDQYWNSYLFKNSESDWIYGLDERNKFNESFTYDEYLKRKSK